MTNDRERIGSLLKGSAPIKWLFAGDSIAQGALHTFGWRDFSELFAERVRFELERNLDCVIKTAVSGWRVGDVLENFETTLVQHGPDVVFIYLGMIDCSAGGEAVGQFKSDYGRLIEQIRTRTPAAIIAQTPNRALESDAVRASAIGLYAQAIRDVARETGAMLVDSFATWESFARDGRLDYLLSDPIHPNELGHRALAHEILRELGLLDPSSRTCRLFVP